MRLRRPLRTTDDFERVMGAGMSCDPHLLLDFAPTRCGPGAIGAASRFIGHRLAHSERPNIALASVEFDLAVTAPTIAPARIRSEVPVGTISDPFATLMVAIDANLTGTANRLEARGTI